MLPPLFSSLFRHGKCIVGRTRTGKGDAEALATADARERSVVLSAPFIGRVALDCWNALPAASPGSDQEQSNCRVLADQLIACLVAHRLLAPSDPSLQWDSRSKTASSFPLILRNPLPM